MTAVRYSLFAVAAWLSVLGFRARRSLLGFAIRLSALGSRKSLLKRSGLFPS